MKSSRFTQVVASLMLGVVLALGVVSASGMSRPTTALAKTTKAAATKTKQAIGESKAIKIALKKAGFKRSQVRKLKVEKDREHGHKVYEVEFHKGRYEYEYNIDRYTGKVVSWERELD